VAAKRKQRGARPTASRKRSAGRSLPGWVWGLSGLAVGLFVALLVHLQNRGPTTGSDISALFRQPAKPTPEQPATQTAKPDKPSNETGRPKFEFYKLLPEQEVEVPEPKEDKTASVPDKPVPEPEKPAKSTDDGKARYLLQAGSFQNYADADRLKASLALLGVQASIQRVELAGGETWHRVRVGPYRSRDTVNEVRRRLQDNDIDTILLKRGE
jgi:cell division protein FtsN